MQQTFYRSALFYGAFALALAIAACGGGSGGGTTPGTSSPSTSPSSSASSSSSPSSSPSGAPTPAYKFPSPTATMPSTNPTVTLTLGAVTITSTFSASTSGSGTIDVNLGFDNGDITPSLTADNATAGNTPLIYASFFNPTSSAIDFGTDTPTINLTDTSGFGGATTCELDVYNNGSGTYAWDAISGATGTPSGDSVTISPAPATGGGGLQIQPGQQIVAISCN